MIARSEIELGFHIFQQPKILIPLLVGYGTVLIVTFDMINHGQDYIRIHQVHFSQNTLVYPRLGTAGSVSDNRKAEAFLCLSIHKGQRKQQEQQDDKTTFGFEHG